MVEPPPCGSISVMSKIPVEIFGMVFTLLEERRDKETLTACSVVSRRWRDIATPYLFSTVTVWEMESFGRFIQFIDGHPHLAACIRTLTLSGEDYAAQLDCTAFSSVLPKLVRLQQLFLQDLTLHIPEGGIVRDERPPTRTLEALEVDLVRADQRVPIIPAVLDMLSLAAVGLLRFDGIYDAVNHDGTNFDVGTPSHPLSVHHLSVVAPQGPVMPAYWALYREMIRSESLSVLATFCDSWASAEALCMFLNTHGASIVTLDIDIRDLMILEAFERQSNRSVPLES